MVLLCLSFIANGQDLEIPVSGKLAILNYLVSPNTKYFTPPEEPTAKKRENCYLNFYCKRSDPGPAADTAKTSEFCMLRGYLFCDYALKNSTQNYDSIIFRFFSYGDTNHYLGQMGVKITAFPHLKLTEDKILDCLNSIMPFKHVDFVQNGKNYNFTFHQLPDFILSSAAEDLYVQCLSVFIWDYLENQNYVHIAFNFVDDRNKTSQTYSSDQVSIGKVAKKFH
jgi:hypothetical protein